ncbi:acid protease [Cutaneotrichosporon oleaginosum]|uniref:Acid protease n=1 Tax=Cutaneotrichosporon oleaginosum TaxID=879819 RepID=A0A0J0XN40_9TREE|nr:acid protease [Cutaneotrichosporon oleaginosum]KLT42530.1 acid protease [Cutaneotrichosporon oleaginosum]TXT07801.1 hypothetical protein COLE_04725 [Cutaneotrichosporon oleaginosum]
MYVSALVLVLLPLAFGLEERDLHQLDLRDLPAHAPQRARGYRACAGSRHSKRAPAPHLSVGGLSVGVHEQERPKLERRAANGSIIALGSAANTYVVPIGLGTPGIAYPLQLDTGSSDLLLASSGCGHNCPEDTESTPYYDLKYHSSSFVAVGNNDTLWHSAFGDGTVASGFVARERVGISTVSIDGQVFGLMNSTNLTMSEQQISGIIGLGFPRLSTLSRILLQSNAASRGAAPAPSSVHAAASQMEDLTGSTSIGTPSSTPDSVLGGQSPSPAPERRQQSSAVGQSASPSANSSAGQSAYLSPVLESLVTQALVPFPAFGLALSPPANYSFPAPDAVSNGARSRYSLRVGSLTIGGVSELYVSSNSTTGRTVNDIEWHPVVPFAPLNTTGAGPSLSPSAMPSPSGVGGVPQSLAELESESYLYWALQMTHVAVNGTAMPVNSTYRSQGIPSIAVIDAGSNGLYGPEQDVAQIFRNIKMARQVATGQWAVPCDTKATLGFSFGGRFVTLQPSDWMYAAVAGSSFCLAWPVAVPQTGDGVDWTLGTPFLRSTYTMFNYGFNGGQAPQIGFLPLQDAAPASSSSAPVPVTPASMTQTVGTTLPNYLITGPNYPVPSYIFNTPAPQTGAPQTMGLAPASLYSASTPPVVSLLSARPSTTATASVPDVPGWPGDSAEHATSGAATVSVGAVVVLGAVLAAAL